MFIRCFQNKSFQTLSLPEASQWCTKYVKKKKLEICDRPSTIRFQHVIAIAVHMVAISVSGDVTSEGLRRRWHTLGPIRLAVTFLCLITVCALWWEEENYLTRRNISYLYHWPDLHSVVFFLLLAFHWFIRPVNFMLILCV